MDILVICPGTCRDAVKEAAQKVIGHTDRSPGGRAGNKDRFISSGSVSISTMRLKIAAVGITLLFLVQMIPDNEAIDPTPPPTVIRLFGNGSTESQCDFSAGGTGNANLSIQTGMVIDHCSMAISSDRIPERNELPKNVIIDVGNNQINDWAFKKPGIGSMGFQDRFYNDTSENTLNVKQDNQTNTSIFLPINASISTAKCSIDAIAPLPNVSITDGILKNSYPFGEDPRFPLRHQWLYLSDEIGRSGIIENFYLRKSGTNPCIFNNFKMSFCNTTLQVYLIITRRTIMEMSRGCDY